MAIARNVADQLKKDGVQDGTQVFDKSELFRAIDKCQGCKLCSLDVNKVRLKPWGFIHSVFMMIGQNPSSASSKDFTASKENYFWWPKSSNGTFNANYELLKDMFQTLGIDFYTMWKTNAQKCRYSTNDDFDAQCLSTCSTEILAKEIELVDPKVIFLLGSEVAKEFGITEKHKMIKKDGRFFVWIYHPSYHSRGGITKVDYVNQLLPLSRELKKVRNQTYINYHHHNQFSLRDGLGDEKDIVARLCELRYPGFSLTNHGNVNVHFRQYNAAKTVGIKPIFGTECYYNPFRAQLMATLGAVDKAQATERKGLGQETYHLTVIAKNEVGYYNLISMNNEALMTSFYKNPLIDDTLLDKYKEGLIVFSGCPGAFIPVHLMGDDKLAYEKAEKFKSMFGDDFYIELMSTRHDFQKNLNAKLLKLADDLKLKCVITNDSHYIKKEHSRVHDILLLGGTEATLEDANDPSKKIWQFQVKDLHIKTTDEIELDRKWFCIPEFTAERLDDVFDNIHNIFSKIEAFNIDASIRYPKLADDVDSVKMFKDLIVSGIRKKQKYLTIDEEFKKRLQFEMDNIIQLGFVDYLLVLQDVLNWVKKNHGEYSVGPGRGSSAASLVCYLLGITDVNPMKYKLLLFERFMSPGRKDPLDIDTDLGPSIRGAALDYAIQKYGRNQVFPVGTQGTLKLKMAIHDVFKALGEPFQEVVKFTKLIHDDTLEADDTADVIKKIPQLKKLFDLHPEALEYVDALRNRVRSYGQHAAGVVISGVDITKTLPLARTSADVYVTSNTEGGDNHEITQLGFIKYDLLSLSTVDLINDVSKLIKQRHGLDIVWDDIHNRDQEFKEMYDILGQGDCYGIFQFGSKLAIDYLKQLKPSNIDDLCAASALLRPGPLDEQAHITYARRKNGIEDPDVHPALSPFLGETFGVLIYQEQVLRIVQELCGFSQEEANKFRKDLVKYEKALEYERLRLDRVLSKKTKIIEKFQENGMSPEVAQRWWDYIEAFSRYAFNFAHSLSYSYHSFRQLWQKYYYTIEFYTAAFNIEAPDSYGRIVSNIQRFPARKLVDGKLEEYKITLLPPDLRKRNKNFVIEGDSIRHGLTNIKFITADGFDNVMKLTDDEISTFEKMILAKREVAGKQKFIIDKKTISALIYSGALDFYDKPRSDLAQIYASKRKSDLEVKTEREDLINLEDYYLGYSVLKRDKFVRIKALLESKQFKTVADLDGIHTREVAVEACTIKSISDKKTKRGKPYRIISCETLEDLYSPVFVWDPKLRLEASHDYLVKFTKEGDFVKIIEATQLENI